MWTYACNITHIHAHAQARTHTCVYVLSCCSTSLRNFFLKLAFFLDYVYFGRCQWPRGLKRWPVVALILGLRFRIPPGAWGLPLESVVFCHVEVSAKVRSLVQRSPTHFTHSECDLEASTVRRPWASRGFCTMEKICLFWSKFFRAIKTFDINKFIKKKN
jgi:hypothetical protein